MQPLGADEPTVVGPYRLLGRLGAGGMGRVYLGRSAGGRTVAVKIVHPHFAYDEEFRTRFRREVDAARRVGGAWTAPVLDADPDAAVPWVATAYVAGPSLTAAVAEGGPLPAHSVRALGAGLAEALAAVHELGLVHRDVKPSNVLLTLDGPLLIDFGIARATEGTASLTSTGVSVGSPGYMSPEQILGKGISGAADVFSLGAVLAYAATGQPPFPGDSSAALLYKVVHEEPRLDGLEALDGGLRELVADCLAKEPSARPAPAEISGRLAPEGAARLVAGGWLPGPLVERVSRSAVQLLNLEAVDTSPSGPVGFSSPAVGVGAGAQGTQGTFGPPPVMTPGGTDGSGPYGSGSQVPYASDPRMASSPSVAGTGTGASTGMGTGGGVPEPRDATPAPGRLSVSVAATSTTGDGGRGRRMSCTVALAVAGALAAVTVGSVFVLDLLPGEKKESAGSDSGADSGSDPAKTPSATASSSEESGPGVVPARYLGAWEGQGTASGGLVPMGTFRVTVEQTKIGGSLGEVLNTDPIGGECVDELTLEKVEENRLIAKGRGAKGNPATCAKEEHTVWLTPTGDDVTYESDSQASGSPTARLTKVE
ncbi:protein kinase [Streptomyces sp. NPDC088387]|uniref:serine/threonine-protein kinase n=1 Tax=Streptomyces sp. NPDC088387 TaxID=3365859 RepID=UPI003811EA1A